jgi:hypothetical protein
MWKVTLEGNNYSTTLTLEKDGMKLRALCMFDEIDEYIKTRHLEIRSAKGYCPESYIILNADKVRSSINTDHRCESEYRGLGGNQIYEEIKIQHNRNTILPIYKTTIPSLHNYSFLCLDEFNIDSCEQKPTIKDYRVNTSSMPDLSVDEYKKKYCVYDTDHNEWIMISQGFLLPT